jgi:cytochrome P450
MPRKALVPFTFSDGTTIPAGTILSAASLAVHMDEELYENADQFVPFRFFDLREKAVASGDDDRRHRLTGAGVSYLPFGGGRHLW